MVATPIYLDNHATTRVDPRVIEAMLPCFAEEYGNPGSTTHGFGWRAKHLVDQARETVAAALGARPSEVVFTSGATESNNLAIRGVAEHDRRRGNHLVSVATEHKAVLDPLERLARKGYEITRLPVAPQKDPRAGTVRVEQVAEAIRDDTCLVSVMFANNEIGVLQPIAEIGALCRQRGVPLHCDATQAVGRIPVDVEAMQIDLLSFSAHKIYGPKGVGALLVRRRPPLVRIQPLIDGGGQEFGLRSGTLNVPGIVGLAAALRLCLEEMPAEAPRLAALRDRLFAGLREAAADLRLNGPPLHPQVRLPGNLNVGFPGIDGEALMLSMKEVAVSSGSACTSANPEPSHVLRALGLSEDEVRSSLRFGLGRFNTAEEIDYVVDLARSAVARLRQFSRA